MRKLASIREIAEIYPIEGADRIEVARVDGWECVVKKGEFSVGEKIVYIEVDSIVPEWPEFEFLRDRKFRVRTIKLRKQVSQGLVIGVDILYTHGDENHTYELGEDVTDVLHIVKYDPQMQAENELVRKSAPKSKLSKLLMRFAWYRKLVQKKTGKKPFPDWIAKTDETRIQNLVHMFERERDGQNLFFATEKVDGQSATYYLRRIRRNKYEFGVCSRNWQLVKPDDSSYWTVAKQYGIEDVLKNIISIDGDQWVVLQGEICGNGIQKNKYHIDGYEFFAFNLIVPENKGRSFTTQYMKELLDPFGIPTVPVLNTEMTLPDTIQELVECSKGMSVLRDNQKREGLVIRSLDRSISFKVINPDFLLAESDD